VCRSIAVEDGNERDRQVGAGSDLGNEKIAETGNDAEEEAETDTLEAGWYLTGVEG
jgi:hypothetical protein